MREKLCLDASGLVIEHVPWYFYFS